MNLEDRIFLDTFFVRKLHVPLGSSRIYRQNMISHLLGLVACVDRDLLRNCSRRLGSSIRDLKLVHSREYCVLDVP